MSILIKRLHILTTILATVVFLMLTLTQLPLFMCILFYRSLVWLVAKYFRPDLDCFLTKENAVFAIDPHTGAQKNTNIMVSGIINGKLNAISIRRLFQERILNQTNDKNQNVYLRLRQTWTSFLGYAFWKTDQNFSLEKHVREYDYTGEMALPSPCTQSEISKIMGKLLDSPWTKNQSPWEFLLINNLIYGESPESTTCVIFKIDHILGDGYSILNLFEQLLNRNFSLPDIVQNQRKLSYLEKLGLILRGPYDLVENILTIAFSRRIYEGDLSQEVISIVSPLVPVSLIKDIKNHYKVSYATVLQSAVQGATVRALKLAKMAVPKDLSGIFVLPIPNHPGGMVIHALFLGVQLPCEAYSSVDRLYKTQKVLQDLSHSTAGLSVMFLARLGAYLPITVLQRIFKLMCSTGMSFSISHFPVTTTTDYFQGLELLEIMHYVGTISSLGMTVFTGGTNNQQRFTFIVDKNIFGSEEIASSLGPSVLKELHDLAARVT